MADKPHCNRVTLRNDSIRILLGIAAVELVRDGRLRRVEAGDSLYLACVLFEVSPVWPSDPLDVSRLDLALWSIEARTPEVGAFLRHRFETAVLAARFLPDARERRRYFVTLRRLAMGASRPRAARSGPSWSTGLTV